MVRQALFSMLGEKVVGARVLDLYAGSGALGIEAWSRGAALVCWVERDRATFRVLQQNVKDLCREGGQVRCALADVERFGASAEAAGPFDLVLADPPYESGGGGESLRKTLRWLARFAILKPDGYVVFEQSASDKPWEPPGWKLVRARTYGQSRLLIFCRQEEDGAKEQG